ncbi:MAG TPA: 2-C-methyl-D-erythritol 4-phosphate cytidylyltransferase [Deltaproteobacteria bacterium]|nr:2-C-methyl-D-erythritol 4-phosphate cytidylyltransferase [Deltaproteobacteria bacterium]
MAVNAIIVAGGSGVRFGRKKQFVTLGGIPVLRRTAETFDAHPLISTIIVVVPAEDVSHVAEIINGLKKRVILTAGGSSRKESVWNGLQVLPSDDPVLIHDGVRPLVSQTLISRVIEGLENADACIPGIALTDTIKETYGDFVKKTIPRDNVYLIQTPQAFRHVSIIKAHAGSRNSGPETITDDSTLVENIGGKVKLVPGDPYNIKITRTEDHSIAEAILQCLTG